MYSPDTLNRLNAEAVQKHIDEVGQAVVEEQCMVCGGSGSVVDPMHNDVMDCPVCNNRGTVPVVDEDAPQCDYCGEIAVVAIPIYNPADMVRDPPVEGAYSMINMCKEHKDSGYEMEEAFYCGGCGKLFITHHSWDSLMVIIDDEQYCHECALDRIGPRPIADVVAELQAAEAGVIRLSNWYRINRAPGYDEIWSGEYCESPDFPGYQSLDRVADDIKAACKEAHVTEVMTFVTHNYQFNVVLGVFAKTAAAADVAVEAEVAVEGGSDAGDK